MSVYVVFSTYFIGGMFGIYSSIRRARIAFEDFLANDENIVAFEDLGNYSYCFTDTDGVTYKAEITFEGVDDEFREGICHDD